MSFQIPYAEDGGPASPELDAGPATRVVIKNYNPDPPNENFTYTGSYFVMVSLTGTLSGDIGTAEIGIAGDDGQYAGPMPLPVGAFSLTLLGSIDDAGDNGFDVVLTYGEGSPEIEITGSAFAAFPSGWFPWQ